MDTKTRRFGMAVATEVKTRRVRNAVSWTALVLAAVLAFFVVTIYTGFPGPGPLRRYSNTDLTATAQAVNRNDGLWMQEGPSPELPDKPATIDWLRSRVVLHGASHLCMNSGALSARELAMIENPPSTTCVIASTGGP
jgi:hypothetical protein